MIKQIPNNSVDLIIIDPPYEYTTGGGAGCFGIKKRKYHNEYYKVATNISLLQNVKKYKNKDQERIWEAKKKSREEIKHISSGFNFELLDELDRTMKRINIYIWCSKHQIEPLLKHYLDKKCNIELLAWHKTNPIPTCNNTYLNDTEYCIFAREKCVKLYGSYQTKRKYYVTATNKEDKKLYKHPTIKPLNIIENLIINSSKEGDTILDCFMGSGTTGVACKKLNRNFIGIEIDTEYFEIAKNRMEEIKNEKNENII